MKKPEISPEAEVLNWLREMLNRGATISAIDPNVPVLEIKGKDCFCRLNIVMPSKQKPISLAGMHNVTIKGKKAP
jgi:hypothetical protein